MDRCRAAAARKFAGLMRDLRGSSRAVGFRFDLILPAAYPKTTSSPTP